MKINSLNLFIYEQKIFLEEAKNNLKNLCQEKNYHFLSYCIQTDNYIEMAKNIAKEICTSCFFYDKKILFIENISLLFDKKNINFNFLLNFFEKKQENIIIYLMEEKNNNFPSNIQKIINDNFTITNKYKLSYPNLFKYIKKLFTDENFLIDSKIISFLIQKTKNNLLLLKEEIQKIKLYHLSLENKKIENLTIVEKLIFSKEQTIFLFIQSILDNDIKNTLLLFESLINQKKEPIFIIYQILNKLQEIILIQNMIVEKKKENEIITLLQFSPEKTFFLIQKVKLLSIEKTENLFLLFFNLYFKIKKGLIDPKNSLKHLLIQTIF